jgi:PKD domain
VPEGPTSDRPAATGAARPRPGRVGAAAAAARRLPADATLSNGVGYFSAALGTVGYQSITATDTASATLTGSQTGIRVVPLATITGPYFGALNQTLTFTLGVSGDPAGTVFTFNVNWGDGSTATVTSLSRTTVTHSYSTSGARAIGVTATGPGGFTSPVATRSVNILPVSVAIQTDPANTARQMLVVYGTANSSRKPKQARRRRRGHPVHGIPLHQRRDRRLIWAVVPDRLEQHPEQ